MTYKELFDKVHDQIKSQNIGKFFDGHVEEVEVGVEPKTVERFGFISPYYDNLTYGLEEAKRYIDQTEAEYVVVLIKEKAGAEKTENLQKEILSKHRLLASIRMPENLFYGVVSVQTAIYIFKTKEPYDDHIVKFIDFSVDGYTRSKRKSTHTLTDTDKAEERYDELYHRLMGLKSKTGHYTEETGKYFEDIVIGGDWVFSSHIVVDTTVTEEDLKKTVEEYLSWKVNEQLRKGQKPDVDDEFHHDYRLDELFDIEMCKGYEMKELKISDSPFDGRFPLLSSTSKDNGIAGYVLDIDEEYIYKGQCITLSVITAEAFYQPTDFIATKSSIATLRLKHRTLTDDLGMYLLQSIRNAFSQYSWGSSPSLIKVQGTQVRLPVKDGYPDWGYMEKASKEAKRDSLDKFRDTNKKEINLLKALINKDGK